MTPFDNKTKDTEYFDYSRIFNENIKSDGSNNNIVDLKDQANKQEQKKINEKKYIATFLTQSVICLIIIISIIITKYANPQTFVSVSETLNGIYENNITLSDLNKLIDEKILGNDALATFFNINSSDDDFN